MNRTLSASLSSIVLIALYFGVASVYQACGKKKEADELTTGEKAVQVADTYTQESYFEDDQGDDTSGSGSNPGETPKESDNVDPAKVDYSAPPEESRSPTTTSGGRYLIVAGNYLVQSNAEATVSRLKKAGYSGAEMTVFDLSQYYTVIAGRYDNRNNANSVSGELKRLGIDNYVLTKK